jgi:hypothetical protein
MYPDSCSKSENGMNGTRLNEDKRERKGNRCQAEKTRSDNRRSSITKAMYAWWDSASAIDDGLEQVMQGDGYVRRCNSKCNPSSDQQRRGVLNGEAKELCMPTKLRGQTMGRACRFRIPGETSSTLMCSSFSCLEGGSSECVCPHEVWAFDIVGLRGVRILVAYGASEDVGCRCLGKRQTQRDGGINPSPWCCTRLLPSK